MSEARQAATAATTPMSTTTEMATTTTSMGVFETPTLDGRALRACVASGDAGRSLVGREVSLAGWVGSVRDHGDVVFFDWRDPWGSVQILSSPEFTAPEGFDHAKRSKPESVVAVGGFVRVRPEGTENPKDPLGGIEVVARSFTLLSQAATPPFPLEEEAQVSEAVLLRYRYLHLRTPRMLRNLRLRATLVGALREAFGREDFLEVETPTLFKSTPEGARDFLVPARQAQGRFYALIQSPQMLKQLLMVGGVGRYMQLARCYRDEDSRSDRQPEFTQLDLEASFLSMDDFLRVAEEALLSAFARVREAGFGGDVFPIEGLPATLPRLTWEQALGTFGSDKPDLRFPLPLHEVTDVFATSAFDIFRTLRDKGGLIKCLCVPARYLGEADLPRSFLDGLPAFAKTHGASGLAWVRLQEGGGWQGPAGKFFGEGEKAALLAAASSFPAHVPFAPPTEGDLGPGTMFFFCGSSDARVVHSTLGALRLQLAPFLSFPERHRFALHWVTRWPLFEWDPKAKRMASAHHPFTSPTAACLPAFLAATDDDARDPRRLAALEAQAFDLVLDGVEVGGGSARIFAPDVQKRMFRLLGLSEEMVSERFGFFVEALSYGTPPHVGMALGVDRLAALLAGEASLRDVLPFPKTGTGACLLSGSPGAVERTQLAELGLARRGEG